MMIVSVLSSCISSQKEEASDYSLDILPVGYLEKNDAYQVKIEKSELSKGSGMSRGKAFLQYKAKSLAEILHDIYPSDGQLSLEGLPKRGEVRINVEVDVKQGELDVDSLLRRHLERSLNYTIELINEDIRGLSLSVTDKEKLDKHAVRENLPEVLQSINQDELICENCQLQNLLELLQEKVNVVQTVDSNFKGSSYDFYLKLQGNGELNDLEQLSAYGLQLKDTAYEGKIYVFRLK